MTKLQNDKLIHRDLGKACPFIMPRSEIKNGRPLITDLPRIVLPYETGSCRTIETDKPWRYNDSGFNGFASVQQYRIHCPYPTMSLPEIWLMGDEINRIANERCHLWMWTTKDFLFASFILLWSWGWEYKQTFTWIKTTDGLSRGLVGLEDLSPEELAITERSMAKMDMPGKPKFGMGSWCRNGCEYLLFAVNRTKGNPMSDAKFSTPNYFFAPSASHSAKPDVAYDIIKSLSPGPRASLFQRSERDGFQPWGNQMSTQEELWKASSLPGDFKVIEDEEEELPAFLGGSYA